MLIEMRTYTLKPGTAAEYIKLYEEKGLRVHRETLGNLIGYFTTEIGDINQIVHLWGYSSFEDRAARRGKLAVNEEWKSFLKAAQPYFVTQKIQLLRGTEFSPIK
ncbi:MAG: NIPSNAP family protein [Xanthobacteraceae bacterium]